MVVGYLVFLVQENFACDFCMSRISTVASPSPLLALIKNTDRGGRLYPKPGFINVWLEVEKVAQIALPRFAKYPLVLKNLSNFILPYLERNYYMVCKNSTDGHDKKMSLFLLKKFLRPFITNAMNDKTEKFQNEMLQKGEKREFKSRKLSKVIS